MMERFSAQESREVMVGVARWNQSSRVEIGIGHCDAALTPDTARKLAAALLRHAEYAEAEG